MNSPQLHGRARKSELVWKSPPIRYSLLLVGVLVVTGVAPWGNAQAFVLPLVAANVVSGLGLTVMYGWSGLLSVGQAALMAVGAYAFTLAHSRGIGSWPSALLAVAMAATCGALLGAIGARVKSHYFILASVALAEVVNLFLVNDDSLTGGADGLGKTPFLTFGSYVVNSQHAIVVMTWIAVAIVMYLLSALKASRLGVGMRTINAHEILGAVSGISSRGTRLPSSIIAGLLAGLGGVLYSTAAGYLGPSDFDLNVALVLLVGIVVGGMDSVPGSAVGVALTSYLYLGVPALSSTGPLIYGLGVIAVLLVAPGGIAGGVRGLTRAFSKRRQESGDGEQRRADLTEADGHQKAEGFQRT